MSRKKKPIGEAGRVVAQILRGITRERNLSYRDLVEMTGISLNRVGIIFRAEGPSIYIDELFSITEALQVNPTHVVGAAEWIIYGEAPEGLDEADLEAVRNLYNLVLKNSNIDSLAHLPSARRGADQEAQDAASAAVIPLGAPHPSDLDALPKMA